MDNQHFSQERLTVNKGERSLRRMTSVQSKGLGSGLNREPWRPVLETAAVLHHPETGTHKITVEQVQSFKVLNHPSILLGIMILLYC